MRSAAGGGSAPLGLRKRTSNLFRDRSETSKRRLDLSGFCHVLDIDTGNGWVDVEGMTTYETLVAHTLQHGVMPAVVPQLKTITAGGAAAGVGIEATSFRHGLVHHTLREIEVLLPDGEIVVCTPGNEHRDLFLGFPNSYGTLGYALRLVAATIPVKRYVRVDHAVHGSAQDFFAALAQACASDADFVDGVVFGSGELVLNTGRFDDAAPFVSDYGFEHMYYRSLREKPVDYLSARDYLWRWDTDWFWCSKNLLAQNALARRLYGRERLGSRTYAKLMRWNARLKLTRAFDRLRGVHAESVIQDVDVPVAQAAAFLEFLAGRIGIWPVWMCPVRPQANAERFALYPMRPGWYVNFGFWDVVRTRAAHPPGHFNRLVERAVADAGGIKSLYSESYFTPDEFDRAYGGETYRRLKAKYDPAGTFPTLYDKCVRRE